MEEIVKTPSETIQVLKELVSANDKLMVRGELPQTISLIGAHGIGKSTICKELANELGRGFYKLNLAQLTEPSELIGYYSKEYEVKKEESTSEWVTESMLNSFVEKGYHYTGSTKTKPCPPDWVVNIPVNGILILDDFTRANSLFSQAVMELVNSQEMLGWDLRSKNVQIILNENPDNGEYNVSSNDTAQGDRYLKINMKWDSKDWAERAEKIGTDERLINFVLWKPELLENKKKDGISASSQVSPRMMDKFFSLISTVDNWDKNLDKISLFGAHSVGSSITSELINFVNKQLDKLPSVEKLIKEYDLDTCKTQLTISCGDFEKDPDNYKNATASILSTRLYNYVKFNDITKDQTKKLSEIILHGAFSTDMKYFMLKQLVTAKPTLTAILASNPKIATYLLS